MKERVLQNILEYIQFTDVPCITLSYGNNFRLYQESNF